MSTTTLPVIRLQSCPKGYTRDLDKTISPQETYERVQARMQAAGLDILAEVRRVDVGRLGIPVYLSVCGRDARGIMPTRKQMGKGSSPEQARASALMELMERFAFFSFWQRLPHMVSATWAEAEERFGKDLLPIEEICRSVDDSLSPEQAREAMSTLRWNFFPATHRLAAAGLVQAAGRIQRHVRRQQPGGIPSAGPFRAGGASCLLPYRPGASDHPHHRSARSGRSHPARPAGRL